MKDITVLGLVALLAFSSFQAQAAGGGGGGAGGAASGGTSSSIGVGGNTGAGSGLVTPGSPRAAMRNTSPTGSIGPEGRNMGNTPANSGNGTNPNRTGASQ
jgi:hypothetical protein